MIKIEEKALDIIYQDGINTFPNECCGFLYGREYKEDLEEEVEVRLVSLAVPVVNKKEGDQRRRFEISPLDYMKAERFALEQDWLLLGVYHSHPNHPAIASEHDLAKALPYFSYVIVSVMENKIEDIKSWRLDDVQGVFYEETVLIPIESRDNS